LIFPLFTDKNVKIRKITDENLKECTFEPKFSKKKPKNDQKAHLISGLERFYELLDLKEKKTIEKKTVEDKMFRLEKKYEKNQHFFATRQFPFKLSEKAKKKTNF